MPSDPPDAYYVPDGDGMIATGWTRGPWSPDHQHGGPPAALLIRAIEAVMPAHQQVVRVVVDYRRPAPLGRLTTRAELTRSGRKVGAARAELLADDVVVVSADALLLRREEIDVPASARREEPPPPGPDGCPPTTFPFFRYDVAYHRSLEMRIARGTAGEADMAVWLRPRLPTVLGEVPTPWQRVMACADSGHGVGFGLPVTEYSFLNPDLTIYLHREPVADWLCLDARTIVGPTGIGVGDTRVLDQRGTIGRIVQSQLIERR